jgi:hypothetical protein
VPFTNRGPRLGCGVRRGPNRQRGFVRILVGVWCGDRNMRSAWICTRNDVFGNLAVIARGPWGARDIMAGLALNGRLGTMRRYLAMPTARQLPKASGFWQDQCWDASTAWRA